MYIYFIFQILFHYSLLQDIEYSSQWYTVGPYWLPILYICVYIYTHIYKYIHIYMCICALLLGRKAITNLDSVLKSRDFTLPTKVHVVKAMIFPVVTYGCESWTVKKAKSRRIDAFKLRCWRRLLQVPWTARRSNQSNLKETNPEYSLEGLMLKRLWCWERLKAGGVAGAGDEMVR